MKTILHITESQAWQQAKLLNSYSHQSLDSEGFIHASQPEQVVKTANRFFKNQQNLVILFIDTQKLEPEVNYEFGEINELFPHIYGKLNIDAVYQVIDFPPNQNGDFDLPVEIAKLINHEPK
ncbi:MAG: DUF952 domain-containing protein [Sphaerospermopsis sp. SIO1G2]|nr:DUF952 domain-containing protein [Sphaerospermopsis sp. SIO1G1]NET72501.1 DUF952 domain-containing protein [Sphaerospermopsis sp. SIO1G2]